MTTSTCPRCEAEHRRRRRRPRLRPDHALLAARVAAGAAQVLHRAGEGQAFAQAVRYYCRTPRFPR